MVMNCAEIRHQIGTERLASGDSTQRVDPAIAAHLRECELCRHWQFDELLRHELGREDIPEPRPGFVDDLIQTAIRRGERRPAPKFAIAAAVAAAAIALGLLVDTSLQGTRSDDAAYQVAAAPNIAKFVEVVIDSGATRSDATLTIRLADNLELEGFPNERVISWQTQLTAGKNLLRLPVILKDANGSRFDVDLSYGSTQKAITVMVRANEPGVARVKA